MSEIKYNDNDRAIVAALKGRENGLTISEFNELTGLKLLPAHFTSARNKHLIEVIGEQKVSRPGTRLVMSYSYASVDNADVKYTENEQAIIAVAATMEGSFTLEDLSNAMGRKLSSGNINGLVKKGNLVKGEKVKKSVINNDKVKVYGYLADIPTDAE